MSIISNEDGYGTMLKIALHFYRHVNNREQSGLFIKARETEMTRAEIINIREIE